MEMDLAYGIVSAVMLTITIIFYSYKNWLALRKNFIYLWLLAFALAAVLSDVAVGAGGRFLGQYLKGMEKLSGTVMSVCLMVLYVHILLYDLAVARRMRLARTVWFRCFIGLTLLVSAASVAAPLFGYADFFLRDSADARGNMIQVCVLAGCLLAGMLTLLKNRKNLSRRELCVLLGTQLLLLFDIHVQIAIQAGNLASYYILACVLISYYILLHNNDQYRSFSSSCFDRDGFLQVMAERAYYKENFSCMGICINNIESITNYCTEEEITKLHQKIGKILRENCGRHNVYHIHSFEYMVVLRGTESVEKKHLLLEKEIPSYFRINNKNISILCGFYTVEFADAGYNTTEFNRTLTSMRKLTMEQMSRDTLLYYHGENQEEIRDELEALHVVNQCIAKKRFSYNLMPIQSVEDEEAVCYELVLQENLDSGKVISQERIWSLASDSGYIRDVGVITFETLCRAVQDNHLLQNQKVTFHINLLSSQLAGAALAEEYIQILKSHSVEGKRICAEITTDRNVDYERLAESFDVFRAYGIHLLLDQFGVSVCSLKNVLNMPFDSVKISHYMVKTFCEGKNSQLVYMARMLKAQGWQLYLDGIDDMGQLAILEGIEIDYIQGGALVHE